MTYRSNAQPRTHAPKAHAESSTYQGLVAQPVMDAIDKLPSDIRACVNEFGYVGVYVAWRHGMSATAIRRAVADGTFQFND